VSSVVVTQTLDWKLHAFDVLSEFDANNEAENSPMLVTIIIHAIKTSPDLLKVQLFFLC
jgi:hypothetical protein